MGVLELLLLSLGLSFDTFAVSVSTGLTLNKIRFWQGVKIATVLAVFQAFMPYIGWLGGLQIEQYVSDYDHWIAFALLSALGVKMILDSFKKSEDKEFNPLQLSVVFGMAVATSIDALVVGVSLAFVEVKILLAVLFIGTVTFLAAMTGMLLGKNVNGKLGSQVEVVGGLILIGIGIKTVISHIG